MKVVERSYRAQGLSPLATDGRPLRGLIPTSRIAPQSKASGLAAACGARPTMTQGRSTAMIRFGIAPTGMRVTSLRDATSTTETESEPALET
jgi:hypothetical protein